MKTNFISLIALFCLASLFSGCVGSPAHSTIKYASVKSKIKKNNKAILLLNIGMTKAQVLELMEEPEKSEGYKNGSIWYYRTDLSGGFTEKSVYGTSDIDLTPIAFNKDGKIEGWGRRFLDANTKRFQIRVD